MNVTVTQRYAIHLTGREARVLAVALARFTRPARANHNRDFYPESFEVATKLVNEILTDDEIRRVRDGESLA